MPNTYFSFEKKVYCTDLTKIVAYKLVCRKLKNNFRME